MLGMAAAVARCTLMAVLQSGPNLGPRWVGRAAFCDVRPVLACCFGYYCLAPTLLAGLQLRWRPLLTGLPLRLRGFVHGCGQESGDGQRRGGVFLPNKGGCPMVPTWAKMKIWRMRMAEVSCSGKLHWWTPLGDSCVEIAGCGGIRLLAPVFYSISFGSDGAFRSCAGC
jgi:hypothetical protein